MNGDQSPTMKRKKCSFENKEFQSKLNSIMSYESLLRGFNKSLEKSEIFVNKSCNTKEKRLHRMSTKLKERNRNPLNKDLSLQDSIIYINDSDDNEVNGKDENRSREKADTSVSIIEQNLNNMMVPLRRQSQRLQKNNLRSILCQKKNRSSVILLEENASSVSSSNAEDSLLRKGTGKIKESSQTEDDIVELWSYLGNSSRTDKDISKHHKHDRSGFMIDLRPNMENLENLETDTEPIRKRRKINCNSDEAMSLVNKSVRQRSKRSNYNWRAKRHYNTELNLTQFNKQSSESQSNEKKNKNKDSKYKLREIIVDGCNVAMAHTNGKAFSEKGIAIVVNYFKLRGHVVKVFLPQHIRKGNHKYLENLYKEGTVVFTPSRFIAGRHITPYDDRYILEYATRCGGIVISSDQYRDLYEEKPEWRDTIVNRLLTPTFVDDYIMFPEDPLGKSGPDLDTFLQH